MTDTNTTATAATTATTTVAMIETSADIATSLAKNFGSEFSGIRVYGDAENPLFIAKDIADLLKIRIDPSYEQEIDRVTVRIQTRGGMQNIAALTEKGLMRALYSSNTPTAKRFRDFVLLLLKRLFRTGSATMAQVTEDLKKKDAELSSLKRKLQLESDATEELNDRARDYKDRYDHMRMKYQDLIESRDVKPESDATDEELRAQLQSLKERYCKPVYVQLVKPPQTADHDYDIDDGANESDTYIFTISERETSDESKNKRQAAKYFIHRGQKLDEVHKVLQDRHLQYRKRDGTLSDTTYETTLAEIESAIDDVFQSGEQ